MTFDKLIEVALAAPPGTIMHATGFGWREKLVKTADLSDDTFDLPREEFELVTANGLPPAEA
jgi:hypothetical protein